MHDYDVTLKALLRGSAAQTLWALTGTPIEKWLNVELPKIQIPRVDLLAEAANGALIHIELQSGNDAGMPLRMAEYALGVYRLFGQFPRQSLVYVGSASLRMAAELNGPSFSFRYQIVTLRDFDGDRLIESPGVGDNVVAILTRLRNRKKAIQRILSRIAELDEAQRAIALRQLLQLAGLRRLERSVEQEARKMPILDDILDNKVLGREFKRGLRQGVQQGVQQGELSYCAALSKNVLVQFPHRRPSVSRT